MLRTDSPCPKDPVEGPGALMCQCADGPINSPNLGIFIPFHFAPFALILLCLPEWLGRAGMNRLFIPNFCHSEFRISK